MNECLDQLAKDYLIVKFCKIKSLEINLSEKFVSIIYNTIFIKTVKNNKYIFEFLEKNGMPSLAYLSKRRTHW